MFRSSARRVRQNKDFELNDSKCLSGMNHNKLSRKVSIFQVSKFDSSLRTQSFYRPRGTEYLSAQREGSARAAHRKAHRDRAARGVRGRQRQAGAPTRALFPYMKQGAPSTGCLIKVSRSPFLQIHIHVGVEQGVPP